MTDTVIRGTNAADSLAGSDHDETILGAGGNDTLDGGGGRDLVSGQGGGDQLRGGDGDDLIRGGPGADTIEGDRTAADSFPDREPGFGNDVIFGGPGDDQILAARATTSFPAAQVTIPRWAGPVRTRFSVAAATTGSWADRGNWCSSTPGIPTTGPTSSAGAMGATA
jgi:Ca2+-binding RTX toxin-like protein